MALSGSASQPTLLPSQLGAAGQKSLVLPSPGQSRKSPSRVVAQGGADSAVMIGKMKAQLRELQMEIRSDEDSLKLVQRDLQMTQEAHDRMQRQVEFEERLLGKMDPNQGLGRAIQDLDGFMAEVHRDYNKCRDNHKKCIGILQKEFGYNPLFKAGKPGGPQFHGNPHVMAKDPRKNA